MITGMAPTPCRSWTRRSISQPSTWGIITSSRIRSGGSLLEGGEALLGAPGLAHRVALHLEVHADELANVRSSSSTIRTRRRPSPPRRREPRRGTRRGRRADSGGGRPACRRRAARPLSDHLRIVLWATPRYFAAWPSVSQSGSSAGNGRPGRRYSRGFSHIARILVESTPSSLSRIHELGSRRHGRRSDALGPGLERCAPRSPCPTARSCRRTPDRARCRSRDTIASASARRSTQGADAPATLPRRPAHGA